MKIPSDTSPEAMLKQVEVLRKIGLAGRAAMTFDLSDNVRNFLECGVRSRHPDWNTQLVNRETLRLMIGEDLFHRAFVNHGEEL